MYMAVPSMYMAVPSMYTAVSSLMGPQAIATCPLYA